MEIASFTGVILGLILGLRLHPMMMDFIKPYLPRVDVFTLQLISFALVFAIVLILCNFSGWLLRIIFKKTSLGWADKCLGAGLAVVKGILICYLAIVLLTFVVPSRAPLVANSKLAHLIISSYQNIIRVASPTFYHRSKNKFMEQKDKIGNAVSKKIDDLTE